MSIFSIMASMLVCAACAKPSDQLIVTPRKVADADGAPAITAIADLGDIARLPAVSGPLPAPDSNGRFTIGELVHIQGRNFGKQPSLEVGGRPVSIVARTGAGGIIARLPVGVAAGERRVKVANARGQAEEKLWLERYAVVLQPESGAGDGRLIILSVDKAGILTQHSTIDIPGARDLAFSPDGQLVLVAVATAEELPGIPPRSSAYISLISMVAAGGPKKVHDLQIDSATPERIAASREPGGPAVVSTGDAIILLRMDEARHPAAYKPAAVLADKSDRIAELAISPDGKTVMALLQKSNTVLPIDISAPAHPRPGAALGFSDDRVPLGARLGFDRAGERVFLVTGDNPRSMVTGTHPTRLLELAPNPGAGWQVARSVPLERAGAPTALAIHEDTHAAARDPDFFISTVDRSWLADQSADLANAATPGQLWRAPFEGQSQNLLSEPALVGGVAAGPSFIAVALVRADDGGRKLGVLVLPKSGGAGRFLELGATAAPTPERLPAVLLQP